MSETDDRADMIDAVRAAYEQHSDQPPQSPSHEDHAPSENAEVEHQREADQQMGLQVAALMNQEDRQRSPDQSGKARDARGRFAPATSTGVDSPVHEAAGAPHVPLQAPAGPPSSWSADAKALFNELPPAVQAAIAKREGEISNGFSQYRDRTQSHAQIESMLAPRRQAFQQHGLKSDAEAIEKLLLVSDGMAANPSGTLAFLAQQFGVGAEQIFGQPQFSQESFKSAVQQEAMALAQKMFVSWQVQEFEKKPPADYGQVRPLMAAAVTNGLAHDPWSAYQVVTAPARRAAESAAKVNRKMAAANASLSGAPHGTPASAPRSNGSSHGKFGDIADDVRAAMAALS